MPVISARHLTALACLALLLGSVACEDDLAAQAASPCLSSFSGYTSPAPGVLRMTGDFYPDESVLVRDGATSQLVGNGTPSGHVTSFTLEGIPSGTHDYVINVSCKDGTNTIVRQNFTIK